MKFLQLAVDELYSMHNSAVVKMLTGLTGKKLPPQDSTRRSIFLLLALRSAKMPSLASKSSDPGSIPF